MLSATRQLRLKGLLLLLSSTRTRRVLHQAGSQAGAEEIFLNNSFALLNIWLRKLMCSLRSRLYALLLRWSELCIAWVVMIQWPGPGLQHGFWCYNNAGKLLQCHPVPGSADGEQRVFSDFKRHFANYLHTFPQEIFQEPEWGNYLFLLWLDKTVALLQLPEVFLGNCSLVLWRLILVETQFARYKYWHYLDSGRCSPEACPRPSLRSWKFTRQRICKFSR